MNFKILSFCFLVLFLNSCRKKDPEPEKTNYIEAKVNGAPWSPSTVKATLLIDSTYHFRIIDFTATSAGKTITIEAGDASTGEGIDTGTRTFVDGNAYFSYAASGTTFLTSDGTMNITGCDPAAHTVSGTFSFTATDNAGNTVTISGGNFVKVSYSVVMQ